MSDNTGIREIVINQIKALAKQHNVRKVVLFGSRARGDYRERSDIDLAVYDGDFARFALDVDDETNTLLSYDIVDMGKSVDKELVESIEREGIVLYEKV
jgi:predicted nucleotidyltransferase